MELTVLHLLLILIGVIVISTIGYQFVSNINEPFYDVEAAPPTCPKGKSFRGGSGTCMDSNNSSISVPICPPKSNFYPPTGKCKSGAPVPPDKYWVQGTLPASYWSQGATTTTATPAKPATATTATVTATAKDNTTPICPSGKIFAGSSGTCMDLINPSFKTASAPICPAGTNLNPETNKCKIGAPALPDQYWLPPAERRNSTTATAKPATATPAKPATTATATTTTTAKPATATTSPTCYDPNGNVVSLTSLLGLSGAPPPGNAALSTGSIQTALPTCPAGQVYDFVQQLCVPIASTKPICPAGQILDMAQGLCITNIPAIPAFSSTQNIASSKAADSTILQNVEQIVRNELLSQKGMTTGTQIAFLGENKKRGKDYDDTENSENSKNSNNSDNSPSSHQGKEYKRDCAKNMGTRNSANERNTGTRNNPDMSEYIRKDSIPCWGCNVE